MQAVSRKDAKQQGLTRYFTGAPCIRGHVAPRETKSCTCIECQKERGRQRYAENPEGFAARMAERESLCSAAQRQKAWRERNPGEAALRCQASRAKDPQKSASNSSRWRAANQDALRARNGRQRAVKLSAEGEYSPDDVSALKVRQEGLCAGPCSSRLEDGFHVDHIYPLSRGGTNWPDNLQLLCPKCNCSKGAKTMEEWLNCLT